MQHHKYSLTELEGMIPWERDIYISMLIQYIEKEKQKIINELGQVIKLISLNENNNYKMEVQNIPSGIYFITNEKASINQKVIIEK